MDDKLVYLAFLALSIVGFVQNLFIIDQSMIAQFLGVIIFAAGVILAASRLKGG